VVTQKAYFRIGQRLIVQGKIKKEGQKWIKALKVGINDDAMETELKAILSRKKHVQLLPVHAGIINRLERSYKNEIRI
jgi:hypothetical protein